MQATPTVHDTPWLVRLISRTAAHPTGWFGRLLGSIWWRETRPVNDHALRLLDVQPGWHVFELGFGPGRTIRRLVGAGTRVTGVDVSAQMVHLASRHNRTAVRAGTVTLHRGDGTDLPLPDGHVDAAVSVHTIYFWDDPATVTAELGRVLRPGGRLVLGLRDPDLPLTHRADPTVYRRIDLDELRGLLAAAGFGPIDVVRAPDTAAETVWVVAQHRAQEVHA